MPLLEFDLDDNEQRQIDIDTNDWGRIQKASVNVYAVDESGVPIMGALASIQGSGLTTKQISSRGAFFVVDPGSYNTGVEYSGKLSSTQTELTAGDLAEYESNMQSIYVTLETD